MPITDPERDRIPFNRPFTTGREWEYMSDSIARAHISGDGYYTKACHRLLEEALPAHRALLTTSCTHALEMTALLLDLSPGDEIIMPAFTFVSTANAYALRGAKPIFVDVRADTLNLNERLVERAITPRTKAVVAVHYAGVGCEMETLLNVCRDHGVELIEDNAHGLFGKYGGKSLGTFGAMATQSFHETKNFMCGEGGALIFNDARFTDRAEILREKGTDRSRFFRGQVDKYSWVDLGSSYLPSDILAAFLLAQLESRDRIQAIRRRIWENYASGLTHWAARYGIALPTVPQECEQSYHLFYLLMPSFDDRQVLISHLKEHSINAVFHYLPLNRSEMARRLGAVADCPVTENVSDRLVRLPFHNELSEEQQARVIEAICEFRPNRL